MVNMLRHALLQVSCCRVEVDIALVHAEKLGLVDEAYEARVDLLFLLLLVVMCPKRASESLAAPGTGRGKQTS